MRYMLKFSKEEKIKYTSHLDMVRMFKRAFQRSGIRLVFSQGFNPHPKMTLAQPLSLGYTSVCEWMEFETIDDFTIEEIQDKLGKVLPPGIQILETNFMEQDEKSLASRCSAAEYTIGLCADYITSSDKEGLLVRFAENSNAEDFLAQKNIIVTKNRTKHKSSLEMDIREMIHYISICIVDNNIFMTTELSAGSNNNLSPELLLNAIFEFYKFTIPRETIEIIRTDLIL